VRCLEVVYGGAIACLDEAISEMLVRELMKVLRRNEADIVRFNHVKMDSCIFNSSRKMSGILTRNHFIRKECHWSMSIPENIDLFYKSLSKKHRGNIKRAVNKLYSEFAGQVNIVIYTKEDELNDAIKAASHISCSTYQHGLGCGFVDNSWMRELLTTAARCGWLRMSVLFVNQEPCAFQIGLRYGEQYMLDQIGFDPKWGKYEVGTILFVKTLEDICADKYMKCIDYGFGDAAYKRSYGDKQWQEVTVHIHASRPYSVFLNMLQSAMAGFTTGVHKVLDSIGLTARIKRYWRGRLSKS
jgi:hypothetical protein